MYIVEKQLSNHKQLILFHKLFCEQGSGREPIQEYQTGLHYKQGCIFEAQEQYDSQKGVDIMLINPVVIVKDKEYDNN